MKITKLAAITMLLLLSNCGTKDTAKDADQPLEQASAVDMSADKVVLDGKSVTLAGVTFTPPASWQDYGPGGMRKADYSFGPLEGESDSASVTVFYFGQAGAGGVMDNINRWIGQMSLPDGGDAGEASIQTELEVDGMSAHVVEVAGTYLVSMGGPMSEKKMEKENYRLYAFVVESPEGSVFFKLTGPDNTAKEMAVAFMAMVKGMKKV